MSKARVVFKDKGWARLLKTAKVIARGKPHAQIGVLGGGHGSGIDLPSLAAILEFGAPRAGIPERSYLRSTFVANEAAYIGMARQAMGSIVAGRLTHERALEIIGAKVAADVRATIRAGVPPPLRPATIARKGSSTPLIDTGQVINSITWKVVS